MQSSYEVQGRSFLKKLNLCSCDLTGGFPPSTFICGPFARASRLTMSFHLWQKCVQKRLKMFWNASAREMKSGRHDKKEEPAVVWRQSQVTSSQTSESYRSSCAVWNMRSSYYINSSGFLPASLALDSVIVNVFSCSSSKCTGKRNQPSRETRQPMR